MSLHFPQIISRIKHFFTQLLTKFRQAITARPFANFFGLLAVIFLLIVVGNFLRKPKTETAQAVTQPKEVSVYHLGTQPEITVQAKIEKSGIVNLVAQTPGVVQKLKVKEGDHVKRGSSIVTLSTNYQGANLAAVSRSISQKNYQFLVDTYDTQKEIIERNKQIANAGEVQASQLRQISRDSFNDTKSLISLNDEILKTLDQQIKNLQAINVNGASDSAILQLQQAKAQTLAGQNAARSGLRNAEYLDNDDKEAAQIGRLQRDNTIKQLELQEKTLDLNKELAGLNVRIAQINESLMYPAAPCPGTVERVFVKVGQVVNPGTLIATIRGDQNTATAIALVSQQVAQNLSRVEPSQLLIKGQKVAVLPRSVSQEPTEANLHSAIFEVPDAYAAELNNQSFVEMVLPLGSKAMAQTNTVPLDAVYQTQEKAYVYVVDGASGSAKVKTKEVTLGQVFGQQVEVKTGLNKTEQIILDRSVVDGESVTTKSNN
jgi:multidrug efflux pump subunit AcrA (membrane-fusion protein)